MTKVHFFNIMVSVINIRIQILYLILILFLYFVFGELDTEIDFPFNNNLLFDTISKRIGVILVLALFLIMVLYIIQYIG